MNYTLGPSMQLTTLIEQKKTDGETCSKEVSTGLRTAWRLSIAGRPTLSIHDTRWTNGERDVVLARPAELPPMPKELSNLLARRRSGIEAHDGGPRLRMAVYLVGPDDKGWPRKRHCGLDELRDACGLELVDECFRLGVIRIDTREALLRDDNPAHKNRLCAVLEPTQDCAPIALYVVTHVVPTLKHIGWL